ncbi:MAG: rod shape-determining protein MreC [Kiritimatiellae bacterium]|nr:rod shape-determining protein MreC [Kiritimatiellia bacterium]
MKESKWIALCVVALATVAMMNLPDAATARVKGAVRDGVSPLQHAVSGGMRGAREVWRYVRGIGDLVVENKRLTEQVTALRGEVERLREFEADNRKLRSLMDFTEKATNRLVSCEIIGRDSSGWWQTARLDKGRRGGVAENRPVITAEGLVGRTKGVSERTADVLLLTDPASRCKVSVRLADRELYGILIGMGDTNGPPLCRMEFMPMREEGLGYDECDDEREEKPILGCEVVTSGLGSIFPRGLRVGEIVGVESSGNGLYRTAQVKLWADMMRLEYAFVIAESADLEAAGEGAEALELEVWDEGADDGDKPPPDDGEPAPDPLDVAFRPPPRRALPS